MRRFLYYLYENFDADALAGNADNPRAGLNASLDGVLGEIAGRPAYSCAYEEMCGAFSGETVERALALGVLRKSGNALVLDCPLIVCEDAPALAASFADSVAGLADCLSRRWDELLALALPVENGFPAKVNLYHLLCGAVFDGLLFDRLGEEGVLATSRPRASGLEYLVIIYEDCPELNAFSSRLLCSYNRLTDGVRALQSFGDAAGDRHDFYRFFRLLERGAQLPAQYARALKIIEPMARGGALKAQLLGEVQRLVEGGACAAQAEKLLAEFGYMQKGKICVPVYRSAHQRTVREMCDVVYSCIFEELRMLLASPMTAARLVCGPHGVPAAEIGNELYHILFGLLNEELVARRLVQAPPENEREGRYLKSIEVP